MKLVQHKKKIIALLLAACVGYAWSCVAAIPKQAPPMVPERSAWLVYWNWRQGLEQARRSEEQTLVAFAVHFDKDNRLSLSEGLALHALQQEPKLQKKRLFLSFVNDKVTGKGMLLKDVQLLHKLLDKEHNRRRHIAELVELCEKQGFGGIEIDYENIWQEEGLMQSFALFVQELKEACAQKQLKLRVVLEPKTLAYAELLPEKLEYVVMFYNLYGPHSGPGPKANEKFILRTLKQMEKLRGTPNIAFANGGYDWTDAGKVMSLTTAQAEAVALQYGAKPHRDKASKALVFTYSEKNVEHEVWYADTQTLAFWRGIAEKYGYQRFSLWRL